MNKTPDGKVQAVIKLLQNNVKRTDIVNIVWVSTPTIASIKKKAVARLGAPVWRTNNWKKNNVESKKKKDKSSKWFYDAIKERKAFDKSIAKEDDYCNSEEYMELMDKSATLFDNIAKKNKLQPYKLLVDKNNEVDVVDEDISALDKILERLEKKGIIIWGIDYQWLRQHKQEEIAPYLDWDEGNVLIISDIHEPVSIAWYMRFCREQQEKYNCGTVIYIGDIVDMASFSYHELVPENLNPKWEVALARQKLANRFRVFPKAKVCRGNHDLLWYRKARTAWLLREFLVGPHEMFWAPATYEFADEFIIDDVIYTHGNAGNAWKKAPIEWMNLVSWHHHTSAGVQWFKNRSKQIFWMQVGTWIDYETCNFDYARISPKQPILSCGVVLDRWTLPIVIPFIK